MSHDDRRFLTPGKSRKRKDREYFSSFSSTIEPSGEVTAVNYSNPTTSLGWSEPASPNNNQILAGYMAYEFLAEGTLFGLKFEPAQSAADSSNKVEAEPNNGKVNKLPSQSYAEVASLLMSNGSHIPGIVNPTELARWFQL